MINYWSVDILLHSQTHPRRKIKITMLMFSRNNGAAEDQKSTNSARSTPQHHRFSTSSASMMSPRGVFISVNSSNNSSISYTNRSNGRNSYCNSGIYAKNGIPSKIPPIVGAPAKEQQNGMNCPPNNEKTSSVFKRTSSRSTMKKNRPHSWHSTLQRGFNRARSRSTGRGEREHRKEEKEQQARISNSTDKGRKSVLGLATVRNRVNYSISF